MCEGRGVEAGKTSLPNGSLEYCMISHRMISTSTKKFMEVPCGDVGFMLTRRAPVLEYTGMIYR